MRKIIKARSHLMTELYVFGPVFIAIDYDFSPSRHWVQFYTLKRTLATFTIPAWLYVPKSIKHTRSQKYKPIDWSIEG